MVSPPQGRDGSGAAVECKASVPHVHSGAPGVARALCTRDNENEWGAPRSATSARLVLICGPLTSSQVPPAASDDLLRLDGWTVDEATFDASLKSLSAVTSRLQSRIWSWSSARSYVRRAGTGMSVLHCTRSFRREDKNREPGRPRVCSPARSAHRRRVWTCQGIAPPFTNAPLGDPGCSQPS